MATVIKIRNTDQNKAPLDGSSNPVIATGELAYSSFTGTQSNLGGRVYIGTGDDSGTGFSPTYQVIGGQYFATMLDHVHGVNTAASAVILDANKKIDEWNVDNLIMNGNTLSINQTSDANGNLTLAPGGTGELIVTGPATVNGTFDVVGVSTLTGATNIVGAATVSATLAVTGESTLASAIVSDLTATRLVFAGASGALVDDSGLVYNTTSNHLTVSGSVDVDNIKLDANTISTLSGNLVVQPNSNATTIFSTTSAIRLPVGNSSERPSTVATGQVRYNTTTAQFEGYSASAWQGLGGVIDADQNTYIIAAPSSTLTVPGSQVADTIYFVTGGAFQGKIDSATGLTLNNVNIDGNTVGTTSGNLFLDPGNTGAGSPTGDVIVYGNLQVMGTQTTVNSTTVTIDDPIFTLGGDTNAASDDNKDRGIEFKWHNGSAAKLGFFGMDDSTSRFKFIQDATNTSEVFSGTAGNVEFGNALLSSITLASGQFGGGLSVPYFTAAGNMAFLVDDASSAYGTLGQTLQTAADGTPFFGHIDCGTY